jgi:hypothetical protein
VQHIQTYAINLAIKISWHVEYQAAPLHTAR